MKHLYLSSAFLFMLVLGACNSEEATEYERVSSRFADSLGVDISSLQWWRTTVKLKINVTTDKPLKLMLISSGENITWLYDYKEVPASGTVTMTAPQGQGNQVTLKYLYKNKFYTQDVVLSGASEESVTINTRSSKNSSRRRVAHAESLSGSSISFIERNEPAQHYRFDNNQLLDYFQMMEFSKTNNDAKTLGLNCNYELESNGPFWITWVNGYEAEQRSRILGYYYHSPNTWDDITYVDLSETHKWDYIDGLSKVQYQIGMNDITHGLYANTWYDANFDLSDVFGATVCENMDRVGDNAYNTQYIYSQFGRNITALRGISFKVDVPEGERIGFYLRSDEEPRPEQWILLQNKGIPPYVQNAVDFKGTCFCVETMNIVGNGRGLHRSFVKAYDHVIWMGMEDLIEGGDHDCNDVIFGVVQDLTIKAPLPTIVDPELEGPDDEIDDPLAGTVPYPWTIAYEDINRNADFDFNDAVIKLVPDFENEECCVWVMAAGSNSRMYLHFDGPDGDENLGEIHELLGSKKTETYINTKGAVASTSFVQVDCVPWPKEYTMGQDAKRFYIEIQRGTCEDCTDIISLANEPGLLPEALLVSGEWHWPMEGVNINSTYEEFSKWAHDPTRTRFWEWYNSPEYSKSVSY